MEQAVAGGAETDPLEVMDAELWADIRRLGRQLGDTLVRQHGEGLLEAVEAVRTLSRRLRLAESDASRELAELLAGVDPELASRLVGAFTVYFHLANVTEQVHRVEDMNADGATPERRFEETLRALTDSGSRRRSRRLRIGAQANVLFCSPSGVRPPLLRSAIRRRKPVF